MARTSTDPTSAYTESLNHHKQFGNTDANLHYMKGFIEAQNNYAPYKGDDGNIYYGLALQHKFITITNAELLTANSVPTDVLAAEGAGKIISPLFAFWKHNYVSADFVMANPLLIKHDGGSDVFSCAANLIKGGADSLYRTTGIFTDGLISTMANKKLVLYAASDPTTGGGTVDIDILYYVIDTN